MEFAEAFYTGMAGLFIGVVLGFSWAKVLSKRAKS